MQSYFKGACILLTLAFVANQAEGAGFGFQEHNVRANGMAGAYTAIADDPSAIYYNPAGLAFLKGTQGTTGVALVSGRSYYRADRSENNANARSALIAVPHGFGSMEINDQLTIGGGLHAPFGLALKWPRTAETRYSNTLADVRFQFLSAGFGFKFTDEFSVGGTVSYVTTRRLVPTLSKEGVRLQRKVDLSDALFQSLRAALPASVPDSAVRAQARGIAGTVNEPLSRLKGDGDGWGYSLSFMYKPAKILSIGVVYRSEVNVQLKGDADFAGVEDPVGLPPGTLTNLFIRNTIHTSVRLPRSLALGVSSQIADRLTLSFAADYTDWRSVKKLNVRFNSNSPINTQVFELKWKQAWALRAGFEFLAIGSYTDIEASSLKSNSAAEDDEKTDEKSEGGFALAIRGGYTFDASPVPGETLSAFLPDNDRHVVNFGVGVDMGWVRLDVSAQYFLFKTVRRKNPTEGVDNEIHPTQGRFQTTAVVFGAGVTLRF
jgi:long-chain fatty acid transport protein